jgi:hypothetical protein
MSEAERAFRRYTNLAQSELAAAVGRTQRSIIDEWASCQDMERREALWHELQGLRTVIGALMADIAQHLVGHKELAEVEQWEARTLDAGDWHE